jgi:hypothetical protein
VQCKLLSRSYIICFDVIHEPFNCSQHVIQRVMDPFFPYANTHNVVIVTPEGIQSSFNALHCCGYALNSNIDDVAFFSSIQTTLGEEYSFVDPSVSYAVGWSNGGFMVMTAAKLFRAVSPISGFISELNVAAVRGDGANDLAETESTWEAYGKGIFLHHSMNDHFVQPTGCCHDPQSAQCCCNIFADECVGVMQVMRNWASQLNRCEEGNGAVDDGGGGVQTETSYLDEGQGISCITATGSKCVSNTTICMHEHGGHFNSPSFGRAFPMKKQVMDFFARDACEINNGEWDDSGVKCKCRQGLGYGGRYCLDPAKESGKNSLESSLPNNLSTLEVEATETHEKSFPIGKVCVVLGAVAFYIVRRKRQRTDKSKSGQHNDGALNDYEVEMEERREFVVATRQQFT